VAGLAGLAVSHGATMALTLRSSPIVAVGELVVQYVPGVVAERAIDILGRRDKPVLVLIIFLLLRAHAQGAADAHDEALAASDDAGLVERLGEPVWVVAGDERAAKITTARDLVVAALPTEDDA